MKYKLYTADCQVLLQRMKADSVDALVTDPPAGISFMGKEWDGDRDGREEWVKWLTEVMRECYRVMKPGAHGLVWALPRTSHWTATALENAGFEIRDRVQHIFGSGFPKSLDVSKAIDKAAEAAREIVGKKSTYRAPQSPNGWDRPTRAEVETAPATDAAKKWAGWGTALKPACEDWWLIRKTLSKKTTAANVLKWGTGALNIDGTRIESKPRKTGTVSAGNAATGTGATVTGSSRSRQMEYDLKDQGRFPSHLILDEEAARLLDEQSGEKPSGSRKAGVRKGLGYNGGAGDGGPEVVGSSGGASRFFYAAKASKSDKNAGLEDREELIVDDGRQTPIDNPYLRGKTGRKNTHPTVKSTKLMRYLCRLITPPNGVILDPFAGSGSTGVAALAERFRFVGMEQSPEYSEIAKARMEAAASSEEEDAA